MIKIFTCGGLPSSKKLEIFQKILINKKVFAFDGIIFSQETGYIENTKYINKAKQFFPALSFSPSKKYNTEKTSPAALSLSKNREYWKYF